MDNMPVVERDGTPAEGAEITEAGPDPVAPNTGRRNRFRAGLRRAGAGPALPAVLVVASVVTAACLFFLQYRPDSRSGDDSARAAVEAASQGTVALLSYSPDTLDKDFAAAKTHLTGDFLSYYTQFTQQIVTPAAKQKSVRTSATVVRAALSELHGDRAVVLVFLNQTTTSAEKPDPAMAASSVRVTLAEVDGAWRISAFDPV